MKRKLYAVLCVLTLLFISGCTYKDESSVKSGTSQDAKATALQYMQDKYGLDCIAVNSDVYAPELMGESYYKVLMRSSDDPDGETLKEKEGQSYLNLSNNDQKYGSTFAVFIDISDGSVIGDQYMWYTVYPIFDSWMDDKLLQYAVCQPICGYLNFCTTDWRYEYCFSSDFPLIETSSELEEQISRINLIIWAFYPESPDIRTTQADWNSFKSYMEDNYSFSIFSMKIREVPDSVYQKIISDEIAFKTLSLSKYQSWSIGFQNNLNTDSLAT